MKQKVRISPMYGAERRKISQKVRMSAVYALQPKRSECQRRRAGQKVRLYESVDALHKHCTWL